MVLGMIPVGADRSYDLRSAQGGIEITQTFEHVTMLGLPIGPLVKARLLPMLYLAPPAMTGGQEAARTRRYTGDVSGKTILAVVSDLMFQSRLQNQARALGYEIAFADTPEAARYGLDRSPALFVIDLNVIGVDWRQAVEAAKEGGVPVLAFGPHTEAQLLHAARQAGCGHVVPRSTFVEELPRLLEELAGAGDSP